MLLKSLRHPHLPSPFQPIEIRSFGGVGFLRFYVYFVYFELHNSTIYTIPRLFGSGNVMKNFENATKIPIF